MQALQGKKVKSAVGGEGHSGALLVDGRLYTWGANDMGVLGHGRGSTQQWLPRMVRGDLAQEEVAQASLGMSHSGCVTEQGRLYTWGGGGLDDSGMARPITGTLREDELRESVVCYSSARAVTSSERV